MVGELSERERNAEFYYHGTSKRYFEQQTDEGGRYKKDYSSYPVIFISTSFELAKIFAQNNTSRWRGWGGLSTPIVLKINGNKIRDRVYIFEDGAVQLWENEICVDYLDRDEFEVLELEVDKMVLALWP